MVGSIRIDNGGQRAEYTERLYRGGKLELTIVSVCRLIRTTAAPSGGVDFAAPHSRVNS
jgi:hypothetical protein